MLMMDPGVMAALGRASGASPAQSPSVLPAAKPLNLNPGVVPAAAGGSPRPAAAPLARVGLDDIGDEDVRVDADLLIEDDERLVRPPPSPRRAVAPISARRSCR